MAYDAKAQEFAYGLYAQGLSKEKALAQIRKHYPGFSGATWDEWVAKLAWKERRAAADAKAREFDSLCQDTARALMQQLAEIKEELFTHIKAGKAGTQEIYAFTSVTKQMADLAKTHLAKKDPMRISIELLNTAFEKFLSGLRSLPGMEKPLEQNASQIGRLLIDIAEAHGAGVE